MKNKQRRILGFGLIGVGIVGFCIFPWLVANVVGFIVAMIGAAVLGNINMFEL